MVVHRGDLEERDRPAGPVIAPESNDGRRLLFLPSLEPRPVLFLEREGRINIHRSISFFCACSVARLRDWTRTLSPIRVRLIVSVLTTALRTTAVQLLRRLR